VKEDKERRKYNKLTKGEERKKYHRNKQTKTNTCKNKYERKRREERMRIRTTELNGRMTDE
jgi:hypothetical protein